MSTSPSSRPGSSVDKRHAKKRDRPPALELTTPMTEPSLEDQVLNALNPQTQAPTLELRDKDGPRSASAASSSLDPYYYTSRTPAESPIPPLPAGPETLPRTPDLPASYPPITPSRDPAAIDRRGLVGVGDLTTPRWARYKETRKFNTEEAAIPEAEDVQMGIADDGIERDADSPWTIEAVDEPKDEFVEEDNEQPVSPRDTRQDASESGGEEIVYPRQPARATIQHQPVEPKSTSPPVSSVDSPVHTSPGTRAMFGTPTTAKQRRPRTSDATSDLDGAFSTHYSDSATPKDKGRDDLSASARKHRSLGLGMGLSTPKDRPRRDSTLQNSGATVTRSSSSKHSRTTSSGSQAKRGHDFSHLPPSPSATTMHHNTKHTPAPSTSSPLHNTSAVAHSLLRGTQEGWSSLDDEATAEALRKLDGVSAKSPQSRTRTSIGSRPTSVSRPNSRPGTPGGVRGAQWEGITAFDGGRTSRSSKKATSSGDEKRTSTSSKMALNLGAEDPMSTDGGESNPHPPSAEKPKKRSSILASKRASGSSTVYTSTPTVSSRDSGSISVGTSLTSASANSHRLSLKARRNSAGSDISAHSSEVASLKDRAAALISSNDVFEPEHVPPVPPLPKDLSNFKSPPHSSTSMHFSPIAMPPRQGELDPDSTLSFDMAPAVSSETSPIVASPISPPVSHPSEAVMSPTTRPPPKSPGRKWSFNPLNIGMKSPTSPTSKTSSTQASRSPVSSSVPTQIMGPPLANKRSMDAWSQPGAMASAASLASLSSIGSMRNSPAASMAPSLTIASSPDQAHDLADSDARVSPPTRGGLAPAQAPLSPSSSVRRGNSTRRLTPSSIPFFRRSSSQIAQPPNLNEQPSSSSPPVMSPVKKAPVRLRVKSTISTADTSLSSPATPSSTQKKSSMLSFLRGSTSRKSLQSESERMDIKSDREPRRLTKEADKTSKEEKKKDDKDRSESRISVLMGRKRGKTVSSTDPKKAKPPVILPPIQVGALPQATAQRVASLNSSTSTPVSSVSSRGGASVSSRVTAPTISSLHKQSDASLRSTRGQLPTIAGSPSVATTGDIAHGGFKEPSMPPLSSLNVSTSLPKETPTKIPRKSGQPSAIPSPVLKGSVSSVSTVTARRASLHVSSSSGTPSIAGISPSPSVATPKDNSIDEFGVMSDTPVVKAVGATPTQRMSVRASPSIASTSSRVPRQVSAPVAASTRKNRESMSFAGLRKASTSSVTSMSSAAPSEAPVPNTNRFSALSPSKGLKLLSPKISLSSNRHSVHSSIANVSTSAASSRQSLSTPSPVPSSVDEEELLGDEEMLACIKRQHTKKLANGAKQEDLDEMLKFPEPLPPATGHTPADVLRSSQVKYLSEYERKEILDFEKVYFFGARSQKKLATLDNPTNNHGYDDDRGDYLVVNHDHLAYRYEVVGSLGKGSFGQVLKCRDHRTGEFVAIKIIRNKKRFHHQALVEIKILENLREWDPEDKHQVIQMIEHFNFRGHLCIAMELLSMNLYELIKANSFVGFSTSLIRRFTNQMLLSLSLMRHHRIVHCDLKPENILLKHPAKSAIKVIDFGSSCLEHEKIYTYIQSRFYRSPEVILGMNYHMAIDMWSLGCIMAELYTGFPIFPGENEQEQLSCIMEVLGLPEKDFINRSSRKKLFFDPSGAPRPVVNSKGRRRRPGTKSLAQVLRCDDELFVDFIAKCLTWDPEKRMKPQQALRHPFILPQRRPKILNSMSGTKSFLSSAASLSSSSRSKPTETPKKSQIGAPAPLSSRISRTTSGSVATTPLTSSSTHTLGSSSRSYRTSQSQTFSTYQPSRTISSFATTK